MHLIFKNVTNFLSALAEMLKKHIKIGDNDSSTTKEVLPKYDMVSHAAEINCPLLGPRDCLEQFKEVWSTVYNQEFLNQFIKMAHSTMVDPNSSSVSLESPRYEADNGDNIAGQ